MCRRAAGAAGAALGPNDVPNLLSYFTFLCTCDVLKKGWWYLCNADTTYVTSRSNVGGLNTLSFATCFPADECTRVWSLVSQKVSWAVKAFGLELDRRKSGKRHSGGSLKWVRVLPGLPTDDMAGVPRDQEDANAVLFRPTTRLSYRVFRLLQKQMSAMAERARQRVREGAPFVHPQPPTPPPQAPEREAGDTAGAPSSPRRLSFDSNDNPVSAGGGRGEAGGGGVVAGVVFETWGVGSGAGTGGAARGDARGASRRGGALEKGAIVAKAEALMEAVPEAIMKHALYMSTVKAEAESGVSRRRGPRT